MSEWWTYRLSDFLMFSPRTYYRMFELYNADVWPGHLVALGLGLAIGLICRLRTAWGVRVACALLAACWLWVAWAFHWQRYATINWAAAWFAAAFAAQGALLLLYAALAMAGHGHPRGDASRFIGIGLVGFALVVQPVLGVLLGRPWQQAQVFGLMPDPTALFTLGLLLLMGPVDDSGAARPKPALVWLLWPVPLLWCVVSGATLWTMQAPDALLLPAAALLALSAVQRSRRAAGRRSRPSPGT